MIDAAPCYEAQFPAGHEEVSQAGGGEPGDRYTNRAAHGKAAAAATRSGRQQPEGGRYTKRAASKKRPLQKAGGS